MFMKASIDKFMQQGPDYILFLLLLGSYSIIFLP